VTGMAEAATQPKLTPWEVDEGVHDLEPLAADAAADPAAAVLDGIHSAAFGSTSALGRALVPSKEALHHVNSDVLRAFLGARFAGSNVVLAAANVDHAKLVSLAEGLLGGVPAGAGGGAGAKAAYVGGETLVRTDGSGAAHVALALPAPAAGKGTYALGVLTALLGGTPAGRSGYARQSRIAKAVAGDAGGFAKSLTAFALPYADAGLVGIAGTAADADAGKLVGLAVRLFKDVAGGSPITAAELDRAKKVYKLAYLSDAESSRAGARDDLGTSILLHGARPAVAEVLAAIDAVTAADVSAIAKSALAASPSLAATGSLSSIPRYDTLAALLK
jgi:predicted Zn-dependent peptidase